MNTTILDEKEADERYWIVIHDLRADKNDTRKPAFNICVYDMEKTDGDWNDYIAVTAADTEDKAKEAMAKFYKEYHKEVN